MKPTILAFFISFVSQYVIAQAKDSAEHIKMISVFGSANPEIANIMEFQNIDYFKVKFAGQQLKGKYFTLYCKEMWDGEVRKVDTLINSKSNNRVGQIKQDTLSLTVFGSRVENKLKLFFRFPMVGLNKKYEAIVSDDYSLRDVGTEMKIQINKDFTAFAYILPYEKDGWKMYCAVDKSGVNVESWGKNFKIKHYLIFEMKFED